MHPSTELNDNCYERREERYNEDNAKGAAL